MISPINSLISFSLHTVFYLTAGYFVKFILLVCLDAHAKTTEHKRSINASAIVEKMESDPEEMAAASWSTNKSTLATTEP